VRVNVVMVLVVCEGDEVKVMMEVMVVVKK
jgi:hypothetical protein